MVYSTSKEFDEAYQAVQDGFASGLTKNKEWRRRQLKRAWWMMEDNKDRIVQCLHEDLHKHRQESYFADCVAVQSDILDTLKNLDRWTADEKPSRTSLLNFLGNTTVRKEPLGVTLIIGAWNFPFCLLLQPMVAAIAAGCAMILKPSDNAPASQRLLMEIIPQYLDTNAIRAISAGPQEMSYILDHRFDHIFYTGSANVAKIIHKAAAKNLTPVTLELGGQGPAIVTRSANINLAAKRIAAIKFMNSGQICLNVNHVFVDPSVRDALTVELKKWFDIFRDGKTQPEYYTHIINERNFDRLDNLLQQTSGQIIYGGERDRKTRFFAPTIVTGVKPGDSLLSEELFGPMLPIIDADLDSAIAYTRAHEHPLVLYAFTNKAEEKSRLLNETQSGGVTFNDCGLHVATHDTPFGGVGHSGLGYYHGRYGVLTFSHLRTTTNALPDWMEMVMGARYPPYTLKKASTLAPPVSVSFDRNGNDTISYRGLVFKGLSIAALVSLAVMLKGPKATLNFSPGK